MKINSFLIKAVESLGKHESLEEDLVDYLLDILKSRNLIENEKSWIISDPISSNKELKNESEKLLNLFMKLTVLKSRYLEIRKFIARLKQQSPKFSTILSNILNIPNIEIQERLEELKVINKSIEAFNNYNKIQQRLLKTSSSN